MPLVRRYFPSVFNALVLICISLTVSAQSQFDVWNTDQGLPQNSVLAILQTRDGYLWLATSDGLVRFDGSQFTVFNHANSPALKSNRFNCLFEDRDGVLWIGSDDGGLVKYEHGAFTSYTVAEGLPSDSVRQIQADPHGNLLVYARSAFIRWPEKTVLTGLPHDDPPNTRLNYIDREGFIWLADNVDLYRVKDQAETVYSHRDGLANWILVTCYKDREGSIWLAGREGGVQRLKNGIFKSYTAAEGLPKTPVAVFYEDREGHLWLGSSGRGLIRMNYSNDDQRYEAASPSERFHSYTTADGLSSNLISSIYEDVEGSLWVGTADNGLNRLRKQIITIHSKLDGLGANVYPILQAQNGDIWIGAWSHGLTRYQDGKFTQYNRRNSSLCTDLITSFAEDREGSLWIGGHGSMCRYKDGKFTTFPEPLTRGGSSITVIHQDRKGDFWFGTDLAGLYRYRDGKLSRLTTNYGLPRDSVHAMVEDQQGTLWIGTYGGLIKFKDEKLTVYTTQDGLASNRIRSLYLDGAGALWIGTYDGGLSRYQSEKFISYTTSDGLFNDGVFQILEDDHGNLWFSCNLGIYRVSKRELNDFADGKIRAITSTAYGKADGMLNQECNGGSQPAGIKTHDRKLWFPTQAGVAIVDLDKLSFNSYWPPVVIESALVDREARDLNQPLRIEPQQTNLEIHYTALSFIKPGQIKFKYKLQGADPDWVDAGNRRVAYFSHLSPGEYTFQVIAANADGIWNREGAQIRFYVRPPFYRTIWFLGLSFATIIGAAILFYRWRVAQLKREKIAQQAFSQRLIESQESERKRIAAELHDSLGQNLLIIKNRALSGALKTTAGADAEAQFEEITASATRAIEEVREIAYNLRPHHIDQLGLTTAIRAMVEKLAEASGILFISKIEKVDGLFTPEAEITLYRILQEAVSNIVRHSRATEAQVQVSRRGKQLLLTVQDNGCGWNVKAAKSEPGRVGFGLLGIAERVRILSGTYTIRSASGQGMTLSINLELPANRQEISR